MQKKNYKKLLEQCKDDAKVLRQLVGEINGWDGSLDDLDIYDFDDEFFNTYFEGNPMEAARAWHFGGDNNNWNDEYIRFNGYGNLETLSDYEYEQELKDSADEIIERALELADNIDIDYALEQADERHE